MMEIYRRPPLVGRENGRGLLRRQSAVVVECHALETNRAIGRMASLFGLVRTRPQAILVGPTQTQGRSTPNRRRMRLASSMGRWNSSVLEVEERVESAG